MSEFEGLLLIHLLCTAYMTGLIWFVQLVHYPLMSLVGEANYSQFQRAHMRQTTWVVGPPMLLEAGTAVGLVLFQPDAFTIGGLTMLLAIWASTALWQVPRHQALLVRFDIQQHRRLVRSNWARTGLWTARAVWVSAMWVTMETGLA